MPTYKLSYFQSRGLAEITRLIFAQGGIEYEDQRFAKEDWPAFKPKTPFGQMPVLEVDGKMIAQGQAIAAFAAEVAGMLGDTPLERAEVMMLPESTRDIMTKIFPIFGEKDEAKKAEKLKSFRDTSVAEMVDRYEKMLSANGTGWFVGSKLTYADLAVFNFLDNFCSRHIQFGESDLEEKRPLLLAHFRKIKELPKIAAWLAKRPDSLF